MVMLLLAAIVLAVLVAVGVVCTPAGYGRQVLDNMPTSRAKTMSRREEERRGHMSLLFHVHAIAIPKVTRNRRDGTHRWKSMRGYLLEQRLYARTPVPRVALVLVHLLQRHLGLIVASA